MNLPVHAVYWLDAESDSGWGDGPLEPPCAVTVGFVVEWPNLRQARPCYRVAGSHVEDEPGGVTVIPADMVIRTLWLYDLEIPLR